MPGIHYKSAAINNKATWDSGIVSNNSGPKIILLLESISTGYGIGSWRVRIIKTPYNSTVAPTMTTLHESTATYNFLTISVSENGTLQFTSDGGRTDFALIW